MRKSLRALAAAVALATVAGGLSALSALSATSAGASAPRAAVSSHTAAGNPLRAPWGVYTATTNDNPIYQLYKQESGQNQQAVAQMALRPRVQWYTPYQDTARLTGLVRGYIQNVTGGNPNVIAQLAEFGIPRWESSIDQRRWSPADVAAYHKWVDAMAAGIGNSRVLIILQPDLEFAVHNNYGTATPIGMVRYAAQKLGSLKNTYVYMDAGSSDWTPNQFGWTIQRLLQAAGIQYTRGFSLNDTHHMSTHDELGYGNQVANILGKMHLPNHFVINTAANGYPTNSAQLKTTGDPAACNSRVRNMCIELGIPPTTDTSNAHWGLTPYARAVAAKYADAYVWVDRPWLTAQSSSNQGTPVQRALDLGNYTPFLASTPASSPKYPALNIARGPGSFAVVNNSRTNNLTIESMYFSSVTRGRFTRSGSCQIGTIVAPGKSCTVTVSYSGPHGASAWLHVIANTKQLKYKHFTA